MGGGEGFETMHNGCPCVRVCGWGVGWGAILQLKGNFFSKEVQSDASLSLLQCLHGHLLTMLRCAHADSR